MFLKNCWYIIAWADELSAGPIRRTALGVPLVLWRTESGEAVAQDDRCPHRMAPLSLGRVEGEAIRCMYHGLKFDRAGACLEIPGQDKVPGTFRLRTYSTTDRGGAVWVWMGEASPTDDLPGEIDMMFGPDWAGRRRYMRYEASYELIRDNLLDLSHVAYVHAGTLANSSSAAEVPPHVERFPWGLTTSHMHHDEPLPPYLRGVAAFEEPVDRWYNSAAYVRGNIVLLDGGSAPAGTGSTAAPYDERALLNRAFHALTPETETSTHYFYSVRRGFAVGDEELSDLLADRFDVAFLQDKTMIEAQAANIDPDQPMLATRADVVITHMRSLTRRQINEEVTRASAPDAAVANG